MAKQGTTLENSNRWSTRQLVIMALFVALAVILSFIEIPLAFFAPFLKYDASFVPAIIGSLAYGPVAGSIIGIIASAIHMLAYGDIWGGIMNVIAVVAFCLPAGLIYRRVHARQGKDPQAKRLGVLVVALAVGSVVAIVLTLAADIFIIPLYMGVTASVVISMLPVLALFNLFKVVVNSILAALVYQAVAPYLKSKKGSR